MEAWLFLLLSFSFLVLGVFIGIYVATKKELNPVSPTLPADMKHRLQLLFDSYSDESIERFIQSLAVTSETLPLHISIGKHFRTQGEVEKAILVHQNLMSHPELSPKDSESVIYELANDYKTAGLYDRAQALLGQLSDSKQFSVRSLLLLLDIHEAEKDWVSALEQASRIDLKKHKDIALKISQYHCELAEHYTKEGLLRESANAYKQALSVSKECYRGHLGLAKLAHINQDYSAAIQHIKALILMTPEHIPLVLPLLLSITKDTSSFESHQHYLSKLLDDTGQVSVMLAVVESMVLQGDKDGAATFLYEHLSHSPSLAGLSRFFELYSVSNYSSEDVVSLILGVLDIVPIEQQRYKCGACGFSSGQLYWQCPSCKGWQTIKPIIEYDAVYQK